jgi:hypothetical protein
VAFIMAARSALARQRGDVRRLHRQVPRDVGMNDVGMNDLGMNEVDAEEMTPRVEDDRAQASDSASSLQPSPDPR